jgi:hypothetical protein
MPVYSTSATQPLCSLMASNIPGGTTATVTSNITGTGAITPHICVRVEFQRPVPILTKTATVTPPLPST